VHLRGDRDDVLIVVYVHAGNGVLLLLSQYRIVVIVV
jgi:hypothetical protein